MTVAMVRYWDVGILGSIDHGGGGYLKGGEGCATLKTARFHSYFLIPPLPLPLPPHRTSESIILPLIPLLPLPIPEPPSAFAFLLPPPVVMPRRARLRAHVGFQPHGGQEIRGAAPRHLSAGARWAPVAAVEVHAFEVGCGWWGCGWWGCGWGG